MAIKKILLLVLISCFLFPLAAMAEDDSLNYVTLRGSVGHLSDLDRTAGTRTSKIEYNPSFGFGLALGREMLPWLRLEGEFSYMKADVDEVVGHFGQDTVETGDEQFYAFMINALFDYRNTTSVTPYAGGGIGPVYAHHEIGFDPILGDAIPGVSSSDGAWAFGYQLMAGAAWEFMPGVSLDLMYRFFGTSSRDHEQDNVAIKDVDLDAARIHMGVAGIRWAF
ncbi:MAG: porin family protein [Desulfatibacillum sp.]|nr:porin family protein [Desulfatibacillum sp.]